MPRRAVLLLLLLGACDHESSTVPDVGEAGLDAGRPDLAGPDAPPAPGLYLQVDEALPGWLTPRLRELLTGATSLEVRTILPSRPVDPPPPAGSVWLSVGQTSALVKLAPPDDPALKGLKPDGYLLRSRSEGGVTYIVATGRADPSLHGIQTNRGALYGAYAALEALGYAFLHPLAPIKPAALTLPVKPLDVTRAPHWPRRGLHIHTMHPIELTELLNGWGEQGTGDQAGFDKMLGEWRLFCEWMLANRQNMVEWVLLSAPQWASFAESSVRQKRLAKLVQVAHEHGLAAGVDVGIALQQQNTFRLIQSTGELSDEMAQIHARVDYLMAAGFDFLSTEIGTSEFTSPDDTKMLAWIDELATYLEKSHKASVHIKIHCSTGQVAPNFIDPATGKPINYNFLPHFAVPQVGVLPHTVQVYALDDPAPTYGNTDFGYMRDFLRQEAGLRPVLWHPETAYWVSYDVDVPLFLPLYAQRRLHDLRLIADDEIKGRTGSGARKGSRIQGQMTFSSGWEWGYWLADVVTARAVYDPQLGAPSTQAALQALLQQALGSFGAASSELAQQLSLLAGEQHQLLVLGQANGQIPTTVVQRNGQAYLQGWEAFDDLGSLVSGLPGLPKMQTQPDKLGLVSMRNPLHGGPSYSKELRPLLAEMAQRFTDRHAAMTPIRSKVPQPMLPLFDELLDGAEITALRARQVLGLYDYVDGLDLLGKPSPAAQQALFDARSALKQAAQVVARREQHYRVPAERIAGWRDNPTAYRFTYLWTVRRLHYWWRDEGKAVDAPLSPCYLNIMDPATIAFGEGFWVDAAPWIQQVLGALGLGSFVGECLTAPSAEPVYPPLP